MGRNVRERIQEGKNKKGIKGEFMKLPDNYKKQDVPDGCHNCWYVFKTTDHNDNCRFCAKHGSDELVNDLVGVHLFGLCDSYKKVECKEIK
jgi:hypothetical protein